MLSRYCFTLSLCAALITLPVSAAKTPDPCPRSMFRPRILAGLLITGGLLAVGGYLLFGTKDPEPLVPAAKAPEAPPFDPATYRAPAPKAFVIEGMDTVREKAAKTGRAPRIILVPENHTWPECEKKRLSLEAGAKEKDPRWFAAAESSYFVEPAKRTNRALVFLDDPVRNPYGLLIQAIHGLRPVVENAIPGQPLRMTREQVYLFSEAIHFADGPMTGKVWKEKTRPSLDGAIATTPHLRELLAAIDAKAAEGIARTGTDGVGDLKPTDEKTMLLFVQNLGLLHQILGRFARDFTDTIEAWPEFRGVNFTPARRVIQGTVPAGKHGAYVSWINELYSRELREAPMLRRAGHTFVEAGSEGLDLYIVIGAAHTRLFYDVLRASLDLSGGRDFGIYVDDAVLDFPAPEARQAANREFYRQQWSALPRVPK